MTAKRSIVDSLDRFQKNWKALYVPGEEMEGASTANLTYFFAYAFLLERLRRYDEAAADRAAAFLGDCGDVMGEWVGEWREQLASGQPMVLPGEVAMTDREA